MSYKLMQNIKDELDKIAEKGLNTGNLETAYKLIDMLKDMENVEYWKCKEEYYDAVLAEMEGGYSQEGYSEARKRDSMGRYSRDGMIPNYDNDNSYRGTRGKHYVRGHYSRANGMEDTYDNYMDKKHSYRSAKDADCKQRMLAALEDHMEAITGDLEEMSRDSDCREEKETIKRYLDKLRSIV